MSENANSGVAVCVTGQTDCDRMIRAGRELADSTGGKLIVMSALPRLYDEAAARVLDYLYQCSSKADAKMFVMYTDHPLRALSAGLSQEYIGHVVLGEPLRSSAQLRARLMCEYQSAKYYSPDPAGHPCRIYDALPCAL